jgi:DNA-binding protein HU-beta
MTKTELIDAVAGSDKAPEGISKKAVAEVFDAIVEQIKVSVKNDGKFAIPAFGTFTKKERAARDGRNPQTGETIKIAASTTMTFKAAKDIKSYMA